MSLRSRLQAFRRAGVVPQAPALDPASPALDHASPALDPNTLTPKATAQPSDRAMIPPRLVLAVFLVLLAIAPQFLPPFYVTLLNYIGLYALVALGLVL
ncbi:hypothetical protein, partial [Azoarcus indigens]